MGCFDTVIFKCCKCGNIIDIQSKDGDCTLKAFDQSAVPPSIAASMTGKQIECQKCHVVLSVFSSIPQYVPMWLGIVSKKLNQLDEY